MKIGILKPHFIAPNCTPALDAAHEDLQCLFDILIKFLNLRGSQIARLATGESDFTDSESSFLVAGYSLQNGLVFSNEPCELAGRAARAES